MFARIGLRPVVLAALASVVAVLLLVGLAGGAQPYETYESAVSADGPVAQFRFNDAVGSKTIADSAGSFSASNTGITLGGEGPFGGSKSGSFGGESFATLPSSPLASATEFSAEAWVDWTGGASYKQPIFDFGSSSSNYMYLTPASSLSEHTMLFEIHTTGGTTAKVAATKLAEKAWEYVAVTETSSGTLTLYVNGAEVAHTTGATINPSSLGSSPTDYLGKSLVSGEPDFKGSLSNVAFYGKALSTARILAHYNAAEFPVNTVTPTISGTAKEGETLKAKEGTWTGVTPFTYTYQWQRCNAKSECSNITGATSAEYKAKAEDVGSTLRVTVTAKNSAGTGEANSAQTATVAGVPPTNKEKPVISGKAEVGQLLTVSNGVWTGTPATKYTYQWESCVSKTCKAITGATESSYRLTSSQLGDTIQAVVTDENPAGKASATSAATAAVTTGPPVNVTAPSISGTAVEGQTLTANTGTWAGTEPITYTYQWQSCNSKGESCTNISGATKSTYVLTAGNVGGTVRVEVVGKNSVSSASAFSAVTSVITVKPPENTVLPTISGTAKEGETLSASTGTWAGAEPLSYTYQWRDCNSAGESCSSISGATGSTYKAVSSDVGHTLRVVVTAKNAGGSAEATSAASVLVVGVPVNTALPAISGSVEDGKTLKASTGSWKGTEPFSYAYQWQSCNSKGEACSNISGATKATYASRHVDVGATIRVLVTASNTVGSSAPATSAASSVITAATSPSNTSLPSISGTAKDGVTLEANVGSWSGSTPITYAYQWQSCNLEGQECHSIESAVSPNYTLASSDLETTVRVVVTASNVAGSAEATSAASAEVEPGAPSELEAPSISGVPDAGQTLHAGAGGWGGTETEVGYQWEHCNAAGGECASIAEATGPEYTLGEGNVGATVRLRVGVSNPLGSVTAVSPATEVISAASTLASTSPPSITGTPVSGQVLTASAGSWLGTATIGYSYQWELCNAYGGGCENLSGATASTYLLGAGSLGHTLRVRVSASETGGVASQTTSATAPIAAEGAPESIGAPAVSGTGLVGHVLSTTPGAWSGEGSISYGYQWQRCGESGEGCTAISGATASTYTLAEADKGATLRVLVTATDEGGSTTAASNATAAISPTTLVNVTAPSIIGKDHLARALSANNGIWTAEGALAYTYQWERCNSKGEACATISGASEASYTPVSADVGNTLRSVVTATGTAGKISATSAVTPVIVSVPFAPEDLLSPTIEGNLTVGETLTAQPGTWASSEVISYSYQWQSCNEEGEACSNITGATASTYKLLTGNVGATLRVVVTGKNTLGNNSATSEQTAETVGAVGPPANTNRPVISGLAKQGERLAAGNGSWSGSRPLSYYYRWERCNTAGEACAAIEGATKPSYTVASADVGSTLRVKVTATNSLASAGAISTQTIVTAGGETNATSAIELAEKTDPSVLQAATTATIEGQEIKPTVSDTGESLTATTALTSSSVSKETPGEIAVNTPDGELSFAPVNSAPNATKTPTIVNNAAAVFANTSTATDTIVRPDALGATTLIQLHSSAAPTSFSWEIGLGPNQRLEKLSNGDIAVVEVPTSSPLEGSLGEGLGSTEPSEATAEHEGSGANSEASELALEEGISEESPLGKLPAAPQTTTPKVEPKAGELHPQETKALYESAKSSVASAEEHTTGTTLMVIEPPTVMDAKGSTVPASLSLENTTVTMTLSPGGGTTYPVTAQTNIAAPSNLASAAKAHNVRYALDDPEPSTFTTFDTHLTTGSLHVGIARDVIPYTTAPSEPKLIEWLKAVKTAGLQPYITFGVSGAQYCHPHQTCHQPSISAYEKYVKTMIAGLKRRHTAEPSVMPDVTIWGAWNEPDWHSNENENPLNHNAKRAALFWKKARAILRQVGCNCTMVAGEFAEDSSYINQYATTIQKNHSFWSGKPHVWGMHDYEDLEAYYHHPHNSYAEAFLKKIRRLGASRVWFSEQGVALQNGYALTNLDNSSQAEDVNRQREAAKDFLRLGSVHLAKELSNVEMVDYYEYKGPSAELLKEHKHYFDSALLPGPGVTEEHGHPAENPRQAYCVLALGLTGCPAKVQTHAVVTYALTSSKVSLNVNPQGLATSYLVEYGTTSSYGKATTAVALPSANGEQGETVTLSGLESCTTYHYQAEAQNKANEEQGKLSEGGDQAFTTGCPATAISNSGEHSCALRLGGSVSCWGYRPGWKEGDGGAEVSPTPTQISGITNATSIVSGPSDSCAIISGGHIDCWGNNEDGELGNGTTTPSLTPVEVSGIEHATQVAADGESTCALLSSGHIDCWGGNELGQLGNGTTVNSLTPVEVTGITNATAISARSFMVCALLSSGEVSCWGWDGYGEVRKSTPQVVSGITEASAISVGSNNNSTEPDKACAVVSSGKVVCWKYEYVFAHEREEAILTTTPGISTAVAVAAGGGESQGPTECALLTSGHIECWGYNEVGQLGIGTTSEPVTTPVQVSGISTATAISVGDESPCALLAGGKIDCWGTNEWGNVGNPTVGFESLLPVSVVGFE